MSLQARRIKGDQFTAEDVLEVVVNQDGNDLNTCVFSIEKVSGVDVTHGGGGQPNEFLHYKAHERDANDDGIIDYSSCEMKVEQSEKGTTVIKVIAEIITKAEYDRVIADTEAWQEGDPDVVPAEIVELETGEITLEWSDDTLV